jgi:CHAT domain-containing protein
LADGPLTAYDLEALSAVPQTVVLSACDAGRGDGALGLASVLLSIGARTVIAPVTPVRDSDSPAFMQGLHRLLASGIAPARALAMLERPPGVLGVQCFGAG